MGSRHGEPVTTGVPLPSGLCADPRRVALFDGSGRPMPLQAAVLDRWTDGTIRWLLLDFQADLQAHACDRLEVRVNADCRLVPIGPALRLTQDEAGVTVDTGAARFRVARSGRLHFEEVLVAGAPAIDPAESGVEVEYASGTRAQVQIERVSVELAGRLRTVLRLEGQVPGPARAAGLEVCARLEFFADQATVAYAVTVRNSRKAIHPGGCWDLGRGGSVMLRDLSFVFALPASQGAETVVCSAEGGLPFEICDGPLELYQDSSGGPHWNGPNHVNRHGAIPTTFRGYRWRTGRAERRGLRATPVVRTASDSGQIALAMPQFWQHCPKAVEASGGRVTLRLFPRQYGDLHEIQGGEQKTHHFVVAFSRDPVTSAPLTWCRAPLVASAEPSWYCASGAVPYLVPAAEDPNTGYLTLVNAAIDGSDTFDRKREAIDEYGWRHFGDVYADHEAVSHDGDTPRVSHYNNQYDLIAGFGVHFLRTSDDRWLRAMRDLAAHVIDIDIYHTREDKPAYNHGMFWHTLHYRDAGTATHRSYPRSAAPAGGGPSAEHNYTGGLLLHHFMTGHRASAEAVIGLAQWVIAMDDGRQSPFRWLDRGPTGLASATGSTRYHGPGRGPANSINALLDASRLTGGGFLEKAEELIRRCIHPADDIAALELLDAERRWYYTVFLQALARYLDDKRERGELDRMYAYGRASLLHYARWMAEHERPYLDTPERLEYPTETWVAQDMRKSEVFRLASIYACGPERDRLLERSRFFFQYSVSTLIASPTRTLTRPVALLLLNGFAHAHLQQSMMAAPAPVEAFDFGQPVAFVPQRARATRRFVALSTAALVLAAAVLVTVVASAR
jgi:hypothetical protein